MKTADGGDTWVAQTSGFSKTLYDIEFSTTNTNLGIAVGDSACVLTTNDGGTTWVTQALPGTVGYYGPIYKVAIVPGSTTDVWIGLNNSTTTPNAKEKLMKSTDFGVSFTNMTVASGVAQAVYSMYIKDANNIWVGQGSGGIRYWNGSTWTNPQTGTFQVYDVKGVSSTKVLGVTAKGLVYSGAYAGGTWTWSPSGGTQTSTVQQLRAICYNTGYIILVGNAGNIFKSTDGTNWVQKDTTCDQMFTRCIIFNSSSKLG